MKAFNAREIAGELCFEAMKEHRAIITDGAFEEVKRALQAAYDAGVNAQPTEADVRNAARMRWFLAKVKPEHTGRFWDRASSALASVSAFGTLQADESTYRRMVVWEWKFRGGYKDLENSIDSAMGVEIPMDAP